MGITGAECDCQHDDHFNCHLNSDYPNSSNINARHYFHRTRFDDGHNIGFAKHSNRIGSHVTLDDNRNITDINN